ncbi:MAG: class C sortase [Promicromonosporaceae bacterium]|nr:class C sortase [Promicromonosporaceae bacterium]
MLGRAAKVVGWTLLLTATAGAPLYPTAANWASSRAQVGDLVEHARLVESAKADDLQRLLDQATQYNSHLARFGVEDPTLDYAGLLRLSSSDVLAMLEIPAINVRQAVYRGATAETLSRGAGHQRGTSLPIGGLGTHAVISAHAGVSDLRGFTDLPRLVIGDTFTLTTLGEALQYQVFAIEVVEPGWYDTHPIIVDGQDLVTLVTCTPTGVNTHRLLVHGTRLPHPDQASLPSSQLGEPLTAGFPWWAAVVTATFCFGLWTGCRMFGRRPPVQGGRP